MVFFKMNETWYRVLRRLFDLVILLLFVVILLPDHWFGKSKVVEDRPFEVTETLEKQIAMNPDHEQHTSEAVLDVLPSDTIEVKKDEARNSGEDRAQNSGVKPVEEVMVSASENTIIEKPAVPEDSIIEESSVSDVTIVDAEPSKMPLEKKMKADVTKDKVSASAKDKPIKKSAMWLQVGVFQNKSGLESYVQKLKSVGLPYQEEVLGKLTVLKVGPIADGGMERTSAKLRSVGITNWVKSQSK